MNQALFTVSKHRLDSQLRCTHPQAVRESPVTTVLKQIKNKQTKNPTNQQQQKLTKREQSSQKLLTEADSQIHCA